MPKYVVRYGAMRTLGIFGTRDSFRRAARVLIRTDRGLEVGEVLSEATEAATAQMPDAKGGQIQRGMTVDDENELAKLNAQQPSQFEVCARHIKELDLPMQLVDVETIFGGERLVFYYLAENRVDFRELVKRLAGDLQTRIEMRQIGVRDEAKLLGDYGDCGKPLCCNTHLIEMPPVSMKMAKLQKATLDPTKISGRCGRLKCCLRYEYDTYVDLQRELPPVGASVITQRGRMRVLAQEIITSQLLVEGEDNRRSLIQASDVLTVIPKGGSRHHESKPQEARQPESKDSKPEPKPAAAKQPEPKQPARQKPSESEEAPQSE